MWHAMNIKMVPRMTTFLDEQSFSTSMLVGQEVQASLVEWNL